MHVKKNRFAASAVTLFLGTTPTLGMADIVCNFDRYCQSDDSCVAQGFVMTVENSASPAFVWDGPTRKPLTHTEEDGDARIFVASRTSGSSSEVWALTISKEDAVMSLTYATSLGSDVATYIGRCTGDWN